MPSPARRSGATASGSTPRTGWGCGSSRALAPSRDSPSPRGLHFVDAAAEQASIEDARGPITAIGSRIGCSTLRSMSGSRSLPDLESPRAADDVHRGPLASAVPGPVVALRDVQVKGWVDFDGPRRLWSRGRASRDSRRAFVRLFAIASRRRGSPKGSRSHRGGWRSAPYARAPAALAAQKGRRFPTPTRPDASSTAPHSS